MQKSKNFAENIGISSDVWLLEEGDDISSIHSHFQDHTSKNFHKMAILIYSKFYMYFNATPSPCDLSAYPIPVERDMIIVFFQNDRKEWGNDYLDPLPCV